MEVDYRPSASGDSSLPTLVFLHEGLGSIDLWRDFPERVHQELGLAMLSYSRPGYGASSPVEGIRASDYMHNEAREILPSLLETFHIKEPVLLGHSDGASIALIYAGSGNPVAALVLIAPHVFVEQRSVEGIESARDLFLTTDLSQKMAKYHRDPQSTFWGWNNVWLSEEFRSWNIVEYLRPIVAPTLVIQGEDDEYGTLAQVDAVLEGVSGICESLIVPASGHAPHLEAGDSVLRRTVSFLREYIAGCKG